MGLPRGRRWVDQPRKPAPNASAMWAEMKRVLLEPSAPMKDALAEREQLHREVEAQAHRQGELRFSGTR